MPEPGFPNEVSLEHNCTLELAACGCSFRSVITEPRSLITCKGISSRPLHRLLLRGTVLLHCLNVLRKVGLILPLS